MLGLVDDDETPKERRVASVVDGIGGEFQRLLSTVVRHRDVAQTASWQQNKKRR